MYPAPTPSRIAVYINPETGIVYAKTNVGTEAGCEVMVTTSLRDWDVISKGLIFDATIVRDYPIETLH